MVWTHHATQLVPIQEHQAAPRWLCLAVFLGGVIVVCHHSDWCAVPQSFAVVSDLLVPDAPRTPVALTQRVLLLALGTREALLWLRPQLWPGTSPFPLWKANTPRCLSSHRVLEPEDTLHPLLQGQ